MEWHPGLVIKHNVQPVSQIVVGVSYDHYLCRITFMIEM